jgi:hypothetical protein
VAGRDDRLVDRRHHAVDGVVDERVAADEASPLGHLTAEELHLGAIASYDAAVAIRKLSGISSARLVPTRSCSLSGN